MGMVFASVKSIRLVRGTRWTDQVQLVDEASGEPVPLVGIEGMTMRVRAQINGPILLELTIGDGLSITNPVQALIDIDVSSARTLLLPEADNRRARYVYDAVIERTPGEFEPGFSGKITVLPSIARPWVTA